MKPYVHNPQSFREHFGRGDAVFQGASRQRGHGAITKFAVPLVSSGIKKANPFLKKIAGKTIKKMFPNVPFAQTIANKAVDKLTHKLSSKPMIEKVVGSVERKGSRLFKKRKSSNASRRSKTSDKNNIFY